MKCIPLTQGQIALVDDEDFVKVSRFKWHATKTRDGGYYAASRDADGNRIWMHKFILGIGRESMADHKNLDSLDNRRENLRACSRQENNLNQRGSRNSTSRFKGVSWNKITRKWQARIQVNGRSNNLGYFGDEIEAASVYDEHARRLHGDFAFLNFGSKELGGPFLFSPEAT